MFRNYDTDLDLDSEPGIRKFASKYQKKQLDELRAEIFNDERGTFKHQLAQQYERAGYRVDWFTQDDGTDTNMLIIRHKHQQAYHPCIYIEFSRDRQKIVKTDFWDANGKQQFKD